MTPRSEFQWFVRDVRRRVQVKLLIRDALANAASGAFEQSDGSTVLPPSAGKSLPLNLRRAFVSGYAAGLKVRFGRRSFSH